MARKRSITAGWIVGGLFLGTLLLTGIEFFVLPRSAHRWSAWGMLVWVMVAGCGTASVLAPRGGGEFRLRALAAVAAHGWLALIMCSHSWELMVFPGNGSLFTMLFPVTLPTAVRGLWSGGRSPIGGQPRTVLLTVSGIAFAHLIYLFVRISPATRCFLLFLGVVSGLASWGVRSQPPVRKRRISAA